LSGASSGQGTAPAARRAAAVLAALGRRGQTLAVAESLTGGLLAATLVDVPGASAVFRGGLVVYATDLKTTLAGVPERLLSARGPVDPDVALALARGARERCRADWGLATTGVAGPTPQDGHPVGRVYVAVAGPDDAAEVRELSLAGLAAGPDARARIRAGSVDEALALLSDRVSR
jgi:nicotinamide-nucleotide amidase